MPKKKRDPIAVVESSYRLDLSDHEWLEELTQGIDEVFRPDLGTLGYLVTQDPSGYRFREIANSPAVPDAAVHSAAAFAKHLEGRGSWNDRAMRAFAQKVIRVPIQAEMDKILMSERPIFGPRWLHNFFLPMKDQLNLCARALDDSEIILFVGGLSETPTVTRRERDFAVMLLTHVLAGHRLRERLSSHAVEAPAGGALIDAGGRVVHADGDAKIAARREALEHAARQMDEARTVRGGRGPDCVAIWQGLVDGRWSLVESFDSDGKRFLLAHENPPGVRNPRALTPQEARVIGLAVRGHSDKLIGYALGMSRSTAAGHLSRAMRKLRIERRTDLVRLLGPSYPAEAAE